MFKLNGHDDDFKNVTSKSLISGGTKTPADEFFQ